MELGLHLLASQVGGGSTYNGAEFYVLVFFRGADESRRWDNSLPCAWPASPLSSKSCSPIACFKMDKLPSEKRRELSVDPARIYSHLLLPRWGIGLGCSPATDPRAADPASPSVPPT